MRKESVKMAEKSSVGVEVEPHDGLKWHAKWQVHKYRNADLLALGIDPEHPEAAQIEHFKDLGKLVPYEVIDRVGNLLVYGGASALWNCLTEASPTVTEFDNTNAYIGVGNSATGAGATDTDLLGASKTRKGMEATYPDHTEGTGSSTNADCVFKSVFATGDANYAWEEWGVFNASSAGRMLNRKVESLGTKTSAATWTFTVTLTLA